MNELAIVENQDAATLVREKISSIKTDIMSRYLELGRLLREVVKNNYHVEWGYSNFGSWVEKDSGLDMSRRNAFYLVALVERAEKLGIPDSQLHQIKLSKAKEILSLPEETDAEVIKGLLTEAETSTLSDIKQKVSQISGAEVIYRNLRFEKEGYSIWSEAIERVRMQHGGYKADGEAPVDISESTAAVYLAAEFLASPLEFGENSELVEAEFEDVHG
jgi:hypothetical protein